MFTSNAHLSTSSFFMYNLQYLCSFIKLVHNILHELDISVKFHDVPICTVTQPYCYCYIYNRCPPFTVLTLEAFFRVTALVYPNVAKSAQFTFQKQSRWSLLYFKHKIKRYEEKTTNTMFDSARALKKFAALHLVFIL